MRWFLDRGSRGSHTHAKKDDNQLSSCNSLLGEPMGSNVDRNVYSGERRFYHWRGLRFPLKAISTSKHRLQGTKMLEGRACAGSIKMKKPRRLPDTSLCGEASCCLLCVAVEGHLQDMEMAGANDLGLRMDRIFYFVCCTVLTTP